jgi:hypothetical protein
MEKNKKNVCKLKKLKMADESNMEAKTFFLIKISKMIILQKILFFAVFSD